MSHDGVFQVRELSARVRALVLTWVAEELARDTAWAYAKSAGEAGAEIRANNQALQRVKRTFELGGLLNRPLFGGLLPGTAVGLHTRLSYSEGSASVYPDSSAEFVREQAVLEHLRTLLYERGHRETLSLEVGTWYVVAGKGPMKLLEVPAAVEGKPPKTIVLQAPGGLRYWATLGELVRVCPVEVRQHYYDNGRRAGVVPPNTEAEYDLPTREGSGDA